MASKVKSNKLSITILVIVIMILILNLVYVYYMNDKRNSEIIDKQKIGDKPFDGTLQTMGNNNNVFTPTYTNTAQKETFWQTLKNVGLFGVFRSAATPENTPALDTTGAEGKGGWIDFNDQW